ncbi:MAG TPA: sigma-54 dependent transcriptional regulator [Polyangiaceae bacterium]|nr:sigma-54 dependent transcriptional regulator [Polyangiaceae bacterium]
MERTVFVLERGRGNLGSLLESFRDPPRSRYRIERTEWTGFSPEGLTRAKPNLVVADLTAPADHGQNQFFEWLDAGERPSPVLALLATGGGEVSRVASTLADEVMWEPLSREELRHRLHRVMGPTEKAEHATGERGRGVPGLIGQAACFARVLEEIAVFARADGPVLIGGETGTGKEICARAIHDAGPRHGRAFVPVDCASIPDHLFENELFGHARGAFTDARSDQRGLIALADGGTLFLDEVDALPPAIQPKLLRFLQERMYRPLGGEKFHHADVNVLAATNQNVERLIREKKFRSDLFFRLNVFSLELPPLRMRPGDVELLAAHFLAMPKKGSVAKTLSPAALRKLVEYGWPGNVRELANVVQRAATLSEGRVILPTHVMLGRELGGSVPPAEGFRGARAQAIAAFERAYVTDLFFKHGGNVTQAAREARKDRRAFGRLVKKYGLSAQG